MINLKIQRFLIFTKDLLDDTPDISIKTIRLLIDRFESCLSVKEIENKTTMLLIRVIREINLKQLSIKTMNNKIITNNLENEFNKLKNIENYEKNKSK